MTEASEQGMLDDRDADTLSFHKVIEMQLKPDADGGLRSSRVPLAASSIRGVICLTDSAGVLVLQSQDIPKTPSKCQNFDVRQAAKAIIPFQAEGIAFNCDGSLLAVWSGAYISTYSVQQLTNGVTTKILSSWTLQDTSDIAQFTWSLIGPQQCAVVSVQGQLYTGILGRKLQRIEPYSNVTCTAWSVDNEMLAVGIDQQVHIWDVHQHMERFQTLVQVQGEDADDAAIDSILWVSPTSILICLEPAADSETVCAAMLTWEVWDAANPGANPQGLSVQKAGFWTVPEAVPAQQKPHMRGVLLPEWNLAVITHRNVSEDHVKIFEAPRDGSAPTTLLLEHQIVLDAMDLQESLENYITGLALDLTNTDVEVPHPAGAELGFMAPMPLVLITTADHKLQLWSLISTDLPTEGLVKTPLATPPPPVFELEATQEGEDQTANSAQVSKPGQAQQLAFESQLSTSLQPEEAEAAQTALPSDDDDWTEVEAEDEEEEGQGESEAPAQAEEEEEGEIQHSSALQEATAVDTSAEADAAAGTALPSDDDDFGEEEEGEVKQSSELQEAEVHDSPAEADAAAGTALPSDDDADFDDFAEEEGETESTQARDLQQHQQQQQEQEEEGQGDSTASDAGGFGLQQREEEEEGQGDSTTSGTGGYGLRQQQEEEEGQGDSTASGTGGLGLRGRGYDDIDTESETEEGSRNLPASASRKAQSRVLGLHSSDEEEEEGERRDDSSGSSSSSVVSPAPQKPQQPGAFPAATATANLLQSSDSASCEAALPPAPPSSSSALSTSASQALPPNNTLFGASTQGRAAPSSPVTKPGGAFPNLFRVTNTAAQQATSFPPFGVPSSTTFGAPSAASQALLATPSSSAFGAAAASTGQKAIFGQPPSSAKPADDAAKDGLGKTPTSSAAAKFSASASATAAATTASDSHEAPAGVPSTFGSSQSNPFQKAAAGSSGLPSAFGGSQSNPFGKAAAGPSGVPSAFGGSQSNLFGKAAAAPFGVPSAFGTSQPNPFGRTAASEPQSSPFGQGLSGNALPGAFGSMSRQNSSKLSEPVAQKTPANSNAPSDAEKRAQAAENRLKQQSQQQLAAQSPEADQGSAAAAQQAQRAGSSNANQAQRGTVTPQVVRPQPTQRAAAREEDAPPAAHGEEGIPKAPEVSRPEPKLQGEGAQVAAWEADFLRDLYKVRQLKAEITQAVQQARGKAGSKVDTVAGYQHLVDKLNTLAVDIQELRSAAKDMSTESDNLLHSMQDNIQRTDALVQFHAPDQSLTSLHQKALLREGPLEPALHSKRKRLIERTSDLRRKAQELDATLEVLEAKRAQGGAASHSPQAAALQLYAVINAQSNLVKTQLDRLEGLMQHARMHSLQVEDLTALSDSDDDIGDRVVGVKAAQERLRSIQQLHGTPSKTPAGPHATPRSPLSPWQPVKKSPASQQKRQVGWAHSPTPVKQAAGKEDVWSAWNQDKAQKLKQKLQANAAEARKAAAGDARNNSPTKGLLTSPGPSRYKDGPSNLTFPVSSSSQAEGSAVTMQSIHMQGSQAGLGSIQMRGSQSVVDSQHTGSMTRRDSTPSVQSPWDRPAKGTAQGAKAAQRPLQPQTHTRTSAAPSTAFSTFGLAQNAPAASKGPSQATFKGSSGAGPSSPAAFSLGQPQTAPPAKGPSQAASKSPPGASPSGPGGFSLGQFQTVPAESGAKLQSLVKDSQPGAAPSSPAAAAPKKLPQKAAMPPMPTQSQQKAANAMAASALKAASTASSSSSSAAAAPSPAVPAAPPSSAAPKAVMPPMPSMAQAKAAQDAGKKFAEKSAGPHAAVPAATGQEAPKSPAAAKKKGGAMYPPMPTLSQQQEANKKLPPQAGKTATAPAASSAGTGSSANTSSTFNLQGSSSAANAFGSIGSTSSAFPFGKSPVGNSSPFGFASGSGAQLATSNSAATGTSAASGALAKAPSVLPFGLPSPATTPPSSASSSALAFPIPSSSAAAASTAAPASPSTASASPFPSSSSSAFGQGVASAAATSSGASPFPPFGSGAAPAFGSGAGPAAASSGASPVPVGFGMLKASGPASTATCSGSTPALFGNLASQSAASTTTSSGLFSAFGAPASPGAGLFGQTGASSTSPALGPFGQTGQTASASPAPGLFGTSAGNAFGGFGQPASSAAAAPFGAASSSSASPWSAVPSSPSNLGFGIFGLGQSSPSAASGPASSPFGKGLNFGGASSSAAAAPASSSGGFGVGVFGTPAASPASGAANPFSSFGSSGGAFGQPSTPAGPFGQPSAPGGAFGQPSSPGGSFGQPSAPGNAFGQPTGFGQPSTPASPFGGPSAVGTQSPAFGAPSTPQAGFGTPTTPGGAFGSPGFGAAASPGFGAAAGGAAPFGAAASGNAFGAAAQQGGNAFGAAAQQGGGFGAAAQPSSGFAGFGGFAGSPAPAPSSAPASSNMWSMRR